jgi:hypothetical protein
MQSPSLSVTNQKRDIVDTLFHASRAFGHNPMLGLAFPYTWEMESKDWWKTINWALNGCLCGWLMLGAWLVVEAFAVHFPTWCCVHCIWLVVEAFAIHFPTWYALCNAMPSVFSVHSICLTSIQWWPAIGLWMVVFGWSMLGAWCCMLCAMQCPGSSLCIPFVYFNSMMTVTLGLWMVAYSDGQCSARDVVMLHAIQRPVSSLCILFVYRFHSMMTCGERTNEDGVQANRNGSACGDTVSFWPVSDI